MFVVWLQGMLTLEEALVRIEQFVSEGLPLIVTRAPLFTDKAEILNDCNGKQVRLLLHLHFDTHCFVWQGVDTAYRLVLPKYHGDDMTTMLLEFSR